MHSFKVLLKWSSRCERKSNRCWWSSKKGQDFTYTMKTPICTKVHSFRLGKESEMTAADGRKFKVELQPLGATVWPRQGTHVRIKLQSCEKVQNKYKKTWTSHFLQFLYDLCMLENSFKLHFFMLTFDAQARYFISWLKGVNLCPVKCVSVSASSERRTGSWSRRLKSSPRSVRCKGTTWLRSDWIILSSFFTAAI